MEQTLGKRIMHCRKKLGLTQEQLAEKLGVTAQAVSKWENDQSCPDIYMLPKLAEMFGVTTDVLLGHSVVHEGEIVNDEKGSGWEFHWDASRWGTVSMAVFVLLVGALLFAARYFGWDVGFWGIAWPSALLVFALSALPRRFHFTNIVCALLGGYFLVHNLGVFDISLDKKLIFPALIVLFGVSLLLDALRKPKKGGFHIHKKGNLVNKTQKHFIQEEEQFVANLSFGEVTHAITLPRMSRGKASVSFGSMEVDLTGCGEIADDCVLEVGASFGSLELKVPRHYRVECAAGTSFGDISVHGHADDQVKGVITLTGGVSFGELEIHYV